MLNNINIHWKSMPLLAWALSDEDWNEDYVYIGFTFVVSVVLIPITLPLYIIGRMFKLKGEA